MRFRPAGRDDRWVEVFATGSTVALAPAPGVVDELTKEEVATDGARPPSRPFKVPAASARTGGTCDVVRPVHVDPGVASGLALSGRLFDEPLPHLTLGLDHEVAAKYLLWHVELVSHHRRRVPAALHVLGSPSMVVTVLELVPTRRIRWARRRFVRDGVAAIEALADRLERQAARLATRQ